MGVIDILMRLFKGMHAYVKKFISLFKPWQWGSVS